MRKLTIVLGAGALLLTLAGCGTGSRNRPDEFAVTRNAPLVIPPDFALVPPAPGASPTATIDTQRDMTAAMFGGPAPRSASEAGALRASGADASAPGIRSTAGDPGTMVVDKGVNTGAIVSSPEVNGSGGSARAQ